MDIFRINDDIVLDEYVMADGITVEIYDIDDESSGRTLDALMHRTKIGSKVKLGVKFLPLPQSLTEEILNAIDSEFISVTYLDPRFGLRTIEMYSGNRKLTLHKVDGYIVNMWEGLTLSLIER